MSVVNVVAMITTIPGKRAEVLALFNANVPAVHAEDGCIEYGPTIDTNDVGPFQTQVGPDTFVVIEKWETLDHLMATLQLLTWSHMVQVLKTCWQIAPFTYCLPRLKKRFYENELPIETKLLQFDISDGAGFGLGLNITPVALDASSAIDFHADACDEFGFIRCQV